MGHERAHCCSEAMSVRELRIACCVSMGRSSIGDFEEDVVDSIAIERKLIKVSLDGHLS